MQKWETRVKTTLRNCALGPQDLCSVRNKEHLCLLLGWKEFWCHWCVKTHFSFLVHSFRVGSLGLNSSRGTIPHGPRALWGILGGCLWGPMPSSQTGSSVGGRSRLHPCSFCCVPLGELLHFCEPQFHRMQSRDRSTFLMIWKSKWDICILHGT